MKMSVKNLTGIGWSAETLPEILQALAKITDSELAKEAAYAAPKKTPAVKKVAKKVVPVEPEEEEEEIEPLDERTPTDEELAASMA